METNSLVKQFEDVKRYASFLSNQITEKEKMIETYDQEYKESLRVFELDKKVVEVVKQVTEKVASGGFQFLQELVTRGLQTVFTDDFYVFTIEMAERGNSKVVNFYITNSHNIKTPISDCGGGIQVVVSFIVRVFLIMKLNLMRFIALDEFFAQLSIEYADGLVQFLNSMVEELGFKILWVTHNTYFIDRANRVYEMKEGKVKLAVDNQSAE